MAHDRGVPKHDAADAAAAGALFTGGLRETTVPTSNLHAREGLWRRDAEAGGRRPRFLIFVHWPMVMWVTEMFLQSIGVRYMTVREGMGEHARREAAAEFTV